MKSGNNLSAQLRVRLSREDMDFLLQLAQKNPGKINVSQVVKDLIENAREHPHAVPLDSGAQQKLEAMALLLRRPPELVVSDAIDAIESLSENDELPLLAMELRLIKTYRSRLNGSLKRRS